MKTGIELIAIERQEQIDKHKRTIEKDVEYNTSFQLGIAARKLLESPGEIPFGTTEPNSWDRGIWNKMAFKSYKERLIIAGALIAAEIDRLNQLK
jgi:hypothetical protein